MRGGEDRRARGALLAGGGLGLGPKGKGEFSQVVTGEGHLSGHFKRRNSLSKSRDSACGPAWPHVLKACCAQGGVKPACR